MNCSKAKFVILTLVFILTASPAVAAEYPSKPISFVIPWPAGGSTDVTGRALAEAVKKYCAQPVIVENKPAGAAQSARALVVSKPGRRVHSLQSSGGGCSYCLAYGEVEL